MSGRFTANAIKAPAVAGAFHSKFLPTASFVASTQATVLIFRKPPSRVCVGLDDFLIFLGARAAVIFLFDDADFAVRLQTSFLDISEIRDALLAHLTAKFFLGDQFFPHVTPIHSPAFDKNQWGWGEQILKTLESVT